MLLTIIHCVHKQYIFDFEKFPVITIDRDWMIYPKHPIRSLLTSMLRKANIRYPSDVYTFSFEKYKEK
jgi:hypothetical protein